MSIVLHAATRLTAVKADEKQALKFLKEMGFQGLKQKDSTEDRISFKYTDFNEKFLNQHLGQSKPIQVGVYWKFGASGSIVVKPKSKTVVLRNTKANSTRVDPIETHVPQRVMPTVNVTPIVPGERPPVRPLPSPRPPLPTPPQPKLPPQENPNIPGAPDNDDSRVPVTHIPQELVTFYERAKRVDDRTYRLRFMALLWKYLNTAKFGSKLQPPRYNLLKDQAAYKMRLRGRWWPGKRVLDIAPRLFNAHQNFFVEIFLHEMCHQAVSEIDHADHDPIETHHKGHGPYWSAWMRKVGLNPLRFDPNDNSTYMTKDEQAEHQERLNRRNQSLEEIQNKGLRRITVFRGSMPATAIWNGKIHLGLLICPIVKNGTKFAFVDINELNRSEFKIVAASQLYEFSGTDEQRELLKGPEFQTKAARITRYYEDQAAAKDLKRLHRKLGLG